MTWQIVTLIVLTLVLGGGMLWYERSRPPSQIVALVAVLAALAVAGRIVLAPIPNVVATTDIVFFSGFALGPAPGFAVGALGGLVSNFWLGQGVWTPWQMVGWGMTGVAGGALFYVTRGRSSRLTLAVACGAAGLVFGLWMNFQAMVAFGGEMSLDRYLALEVRAIPFDLAHITGNVLFALAVGPAMIAALRRFRERFEWQQVTSVAGVLLVAVSLVAIVATPPAKASTADEAALAGNWLRDQQNDDGGFPSSPGGDSSVGMTARSMLGLAAAGINPLDVVTNSNDPYEYLLAKRKKLDEASDLALVILALKTVGQNPRDFHNRDLVTALHNRRGNNNSYGDNVNVSAYAALAFRSAEAEAAKDRVIDWLISAQNDTGGWGISSKAKSDSDSTGTVLQIMHGKKNIRPAMGYLKKTQKNSGGWASYNTVNSQSTALALQGAMASGKSREYFKESGNSGLDYLFARQRDDGSIWYSHTSDQTRVWVTADTLIAIAGETLPIGQPPLEVKDEKSNTNSGGSSPGTGGNTTPNLYDSSSSGSSGGSSSNDSGDSAGSSSGGSGNGSGNSGGSTGSGSDPDETDTGVAPSDTAIPGVPVVPTEAILAASRQGSEPSPLIAFLIFLVVSGGLAGGTVLLSRRMKW
ncbi:MAG: ECF transporter S component [Thermoleophilia bacterium]|nr:ECF transporter S component [Thermoleophilia bacterium]